MFPTIAALRLLLLAASATAIPASAIFARQESSCDARGYERCGNDFPDYFCCPTGSRCMSLAGDTTVMCCPENKDCDSLGPITCNIRAQDAEKDHQIPLKTTVFDVELGRCGDDGCCPFGFTCEDGKDGEKECQKADDQSKAPGEEDDDTKSSAPGSTKTSDPTSTSEPTSDPSSTTDTDPTATNDESEPGDDSSDSDSGPDTTSIIGGVVGACAVLLIVAVILFICVRKRAKRSAAGTPPPPQPPTTQVLHGRNISGPTNINANQDFYRSDFLQKRENEPGEGLDDQGDGLGVTNPRPANRFSSRFSRDASDRGSTQFPFGSNSPNPSLPETPLEQVPSHEILRNGQVTRSSVPPIRSMKSTVRTKSRHLHPEMARDIPRELTPRPPRPNRGDDDAASDTIPIMTEDENNRNTRFSFNKMLKVTRMSGVGETSTYVPWRGATPRI